VRPKRRPHQPAVQPRVQESKATPGGPYTKEREPTGYMPPTQGEHPNNRQRQATAKRNEGQTRTQPKINKLKAPHTSIGTHHHHLGVKPDDKHTQHQRHRGRNYSPQKEREPLSDTRVRLDTPYETRTNHASTKQTDQRNTHQKRRQKQPNQQVEQIHHRAKPTRRHKTAQNRVHTQQSDTQRTPDRQSQHPTTVASYDHTERTR